MNGFKYEMTISDVTLKKNLAFFLVFVLFCLNGGKRLKETLVVSWKQNKKIFDVKDGNIWRYV